MNNMNSIKNKKYELASEEIEAKSLATDIFRIK